MTDNRQIVAECWTCSYPDPKVNALQAGLRDQPMLPFRFTSEAHTDYHRQHGHDVRPVWRCTCLRGGPKDEWHSRDCLNVRPLPQKASA